MPRRYYEKDQIVASRNGAYLTYDEESHDTHLPIWFVQDAPVGYPERGSSTGFSVRATYSCTWGRPVTLATG